MAGSLLVSSSAGCGKKLPTMRAWTRMSDRLLCFTRYCAVTSIAGLKSGVPKKEIRPLVTWNSRFTTPRSRR